MKLKDFKNEIKVLDVPALAARARALKIEINDLVLDKNISKIKDLKSIEKKRKDRARVLTVMNQKIMIEELQAPKNAEEERGITPSIEEAKPKKGGKKK